MTLTEIRKLLVSAYEEIGEQETKEAMIETAVSHIKNYRIISTLQDSVGGRTKSRTATFCASCGDFTAYSTSASVSPAAASSIAVAKCPKCGENHTIPTRNAYGNYYTGQQSFLGVKEVNKEYAILYEFSLSLIAEQRPSKTEEESLEKAEIRPHHSSVNDVFTNVYIIQFDKSHPWQLLYYNGQYSLRSDWFFRNSHIVDDENMDTLVAEVSSRVPGVTTQNICEKIKEMCALNERKKAKAKTSSTAAKAKEEFIKIANDYKFTDEKKLISFVTEKFTNECISPLLKTASEAGYATYEGHCMHCGGAISHRTEVSRVGNDNEIKLICSTCGTESKYVLSDWYPSSRDRVYFKWSYEPALNAVCLRSFIGKVVKDHSDLSKKAKITVSHVATAFFGEKNTVYKAKRVYSVDPNKWEIVSSADFCRSAGVSSYRICKSAECLNTDDDLIEIIKASSLKYSGVLDAWGLSSGGKFKYEEPGHFNECSYLYIWSSKKYIELLLKAGLTNIVKQISEFKKASSNIMKPRAKNVCDLLGINKQVLKIARETNPKLEALNTIQKLWSADNTMTVDDYKAIAALKKEQVCVEIKQKMNIPFAKQLAYVKDCYDFQCVEQSEALQLWRDYLVLAKKVGYNLKNRNIRYPDSLKKEHDVCSFVANKMQNGFDDKAFLSRAKENARYNYSLKSLKLIVEAPTEPQQVINEGMVLHHCVTNYVNAIIEGRSIVMFVRNEDEPDEPFYTAEILIKGGTPTVTQVKGNMNMDPDPATPEGKKVLEFVKKWAAFKHMNISLE